MAFAQVCNACGSMARRWAARLTGPLALRRQQAHQSRHDHRQVELPRDGLDPRERAGRRGDGADVAVAHRRQRDEAVVGQNVRQRAGTLAARDQLRADLERAGADALDHRVEDGPGQPQEEVAADSAEDAVEFQGGALKQRLHDQHRRPEQEQHFAQVPGEQHRNAGFPRQRMASQGEEDGGDAQQQGEQPLVALETERHDDGDHE